MTLPRVIYPKFAAKFAGNTATFYCKNCGHRVFEVIKEHEGISCSACGFVPKTKNISLAMTDRRQLVNEMFAPNSTVFNYIIDTNEYYNYGINYSGRSLDEIVVSGSGYMYPKYGASFMEPRNFYHRAQSILDDGENVEIIKRAMKKRGYNLK